MRKSGQPGQPQSPLGLTAHRERNGITLAQIAESTKISRRFLESIELGRYGDLPGGVFTISYIRQYAEAIGFNAELILRHYRGAEPGSPEGEPAQPSTSKWAARFFSIS